MTAACALAVDPLQLAHGISAAIVDPLRQVAQHNTARCLLSLVDPDDGELDLSGKRFAHECRRRQVLEVVLADDIEGNHCSFVLGE